MKKLFAVTTTAALVLTAAAAPAVAQDEKITVEGLIYIDRDGDRVYDQGETVRANVPGVEVYQGQTFVGAFDTGADGRYRAELPKGPKYDVVVQQGGYAVNRPSWGTSESLSGADFALSGFVFSGFSFIDTNGDGVKQADEKPNPGLIKAVAHPSPTRTIVVQATAAEDGSYVMDAPLDEFTIEAPDLTKDGFAVAQPKSAHDIDWVTGTRKMKTTDDARDQRVDIRYFTPRPDIALDAELVPAKETYTVGDQVVVKVKLTNKGDVPVAPSFVMAEFGAKLLSHSDNVTPIQGKDDDFDVVRKVLPGATEVVDLKVELTSPTLDKVWPIARHRFGNLVDVDRQNNDKNIPVKVVEKSTTAPTTDTTTPAPTTTTTTPQAVAGGDNNDNLASTGASPLGFLALGGLLLVAGAGAFLVARRRRS